MRKLKSFTLLEMMIALMLTSIIVSISYLSYMIIFKEMSGYKNKSKLISEILQINTNLQADINKSDAVYWKNDALFFFCPQNVEIKYYFRNNFILRESGMVQDTFFISPFDLQKKFLNNNQTDENAWIEELSFKAVILTKERTFYYKKIYSASDYISNTEEELK